MEKFKLIRITDEGYSNLIVDDIWYLENHIGCSVKYIGADMYLIEDYEFHKSFLIIQEEYNDSLENIMPILPSKSINLIIPDFPYGTTNCKWDSLIDLELFWKEADRILTDNGCVVCTAQFPFTAVLAMSNLRNLRYEWIWEKTSATGHLNAKKMPMKAHENVLVFYKKLPTYNPQKTNGHKRKISSAHHKRNIINTDIYSDFNHTSYDSTERYPRDVLKFKSDKQKYSLHQTQKPEALIEYFIKTYTNEGDTVLDPCRGSNTAGVVCDRLNRRYIGIEKDKEIFNTGIYRRNNQQNR